MEVVVYRTMLALLLLAAHMLGVGNPTSEPDPAELLSAPVVYKDLMLILSTKDGVAAVVFGNEVEKGVTYRYRFRPAGREKEETGEGKVFEKMKYVPTKDPDVKKVVDEGSELFIKAGPVKIEWSLGGEGRGWIYYRPEDVRVQIVHARNFEKIALQRFKR